jgi:hypothetical protein
MQKYNVRAQAVLISWTMLLRKYYAKSLPNCLGILFVTDGAPSTFASRHMGEILRRILLFFKIQAHWMRFAPCHGKCNCDPEGGLCKRKWAEWAILNEGKMNFPGDYIRVFEQTMAQPTPRTTTGDVLHL